MVTVAEVGVPKGKIVSYNIPSSLRLGETKDWNLTVHNNGTARGNIGFWVENRAGNLGNMIVTYGGIAYEYKPGEGLYSWVGDTDVCNQKTLSGAVRFPTPGTYVIRLSVWTGGVMDDYIDLNGIKVEEAVPSVNWLPLVIATFVLILVFAYLGRR